MKKRDFIKTGLIGAVGLASLPALAGKPFRFGLSGNDRFELPLLPYRYEALEPYFDGETMKIHHQVHHAGYASRLKSAMTEAGINVNRPRTILKNASRYSDQVVNNAGGFVNHKIFWKSISPNGGGQPSGDIARLIDRDFGTFENFRKEFRKVFMNQSGSGWVWLVIRNGKLKIIGTDNHENPLMDTLATSKQGHPLLCVDTWEHAYYLKYRNENQKYLSAFWKVVDWNTANKKLKNSKQA